LLRKCGARNRKNARSYEKNSGNMHDYLPVTIPSRSRGHPMRGSLRDNIDAGVRLACPQLRGLVERQDSATLK
jgi:hypothetical protein